MGHTLDRILATTGATLPALRARRRELEREAGRRTPPGAAALEAVLRHERVAVIAEIKRRSPSMGEINAAIDPAERARTYADAGASALSVLTDAPFFGGSLDDLRAAADAVAVPAIRKDFVLDEVQLLEARAAGAAAALLIVRALPGGALRRLLRFARDLDLGVLVEAHDRRELDRALDEEVRVLGINSRDLATFRIDVDAALELVTLVPPDAVAVAESGVRDADAVARAAEAGADAVLVGTALSSADDPAALCAALAGVRRRGR